MIDHSRATGNDLGLMTNKLPVAMKASVYYRKGELEVEDRPVPELGDTDVLLEVDFCGVCGSDIHFVLEGWGQSGSIEGHEFSGRVVATGPKVKNWSIGDAAVGGPTPRCGVCNFCQSGRPSLCSGRSTPGVSVNADGAFAQYVRVSENLLLAIPDGLDTRGAALAEPLAVALHGINRSGILPGQRLLITGGGPIGALSIAAARARGIEDIVLSEPHAKRRKLGELLGAQVIAPEEMVVPTFPTEIIDNPFDAVLECSGNRRAMESGLAQLQRGGIMVLVGAGMEAPRFDSNRILLNELMITGSFVYDPDGFERALEMLTTPGFPIELLIEPEAVPLEGLFDALESLARGDLAAKVMVTPNG